MATAQRYVCTGFSSVVSLEGIMLFLFSWSFSECLPLRLDNPLAKSRSRNLVPRFRQSRYLALLIKTREQSVPRAENANRPALKGSPSNMAEMAVRRLEENAVRRNRLELVEPVVAVFCR